MNLLRNAQVHRFSDKVAVYVTGPAFKLGKYPETVYLTAKQARTLARALNAAARDVSNNPPALSEFHTVEINGASDGTR